jgi:hypothetical protein
MAREVIAMSRFLRACFVGLVVLSLLSGVVLVAADDEDIISEEDVVYEEPPPEDEEWPIEIPPEEAGKSEEHWGEQTTEGISFDFGQMPLMFQAFSDCDTGQPIEPTEIRSESIVHEDALEPYEAEDLISVRFEADGYWIEEVSGFTPMEIGLWLFSVTVLVPEHPELCLEPIGSDNGEILFSTEETETRYVHVVKDLGGGKVQVAEPKSGGESDTYVAKNSSVNELKVCEYVVVQGTPINVAQPSPADTATFDIKNVVSAKKSECVLTEHAMVHYSGKSWEVVPNKDCTYAYVYKERKMYHYGSGSWSAFTGIAKCEWIIAANGLFHCMGTNRDGTPKWSKKREGNPCKCYKTKNGVAHYNNDHEWVKVEPVKCTYVYVYGPKKSDAGMWHHDGTNWVQDRNWTVGVINCQYVYSTISQKMYHYNNRWYEVAPRTCTYVMTRDQKVFHAEGGKWVEKTKFVACEWREFRTVGWMHYSGTKWNVPMPNNARIEIERVAGNRISVRIYMYDANTGKFRQIGRGTYTLGQGFAIGGSTYSITAHPTEAGYYQLCDANGQVIATGKP